MKHFNRTPIIYWRSFADSKKATNTFLNDLISKLTQYSNAYYNGEPLVTDNEYDQLLTVVEIEAPDHPFLKKVGTSSQATNKIKLPFYMASLNKIKRNTTNLINYTNKFKGPYVITDKLDGIAGLLEWKDNKYQLYTRGNGVMGQDVSHVLPYLTTIPRLDPHVGIASEFYLRCELIISKLKWQADMGSNARNVMQ